MQLTSGLIYDAHDIYFSEPLMNAGGCETTPLHDDIERFRHSDLRECEVPNIHSTMTMQNITQHSEADKIYNSILEDITSLRNQSKFLKPGGRKYIPKQ